MSTRPNIKQYIVIPNKDASPANSGSMAASITSAPSVLTSISMMSYQIVWSGASPVGAVSVEISNDYKPIDQGNVAGTWTTLTLQYNGAPVTSVPVTGNSGNGFIDIEAIAAYAMRLVYTRTSGSGTMTVTANAKVA